MYEKLTVLLRQRYQGCEFHAFMSPGKKDKLWYFLPMTWNILPSKEPIVWKNYPLPNKKKRLHPKIAEML
jgi:hypothetical protein